MTDRSRLTEQKEADWWQRRGWTAARAWKEARYVASGRVVAVPRDFFDHYDVLALYPTTHVVGVQVSLRALRSNRKAHGPPLFDRLRPSSTVEAFADLPDTLRPGFYEVLASYGEGGATREWWMKGPKRGKKRGLDLWSD